MPWLDPPQALDGQTRLPYRTDAVLVAVAAGGIMIGILMFALGQGWLVVAGLSGGPLWLLSLFGMTAFATAVLLAARAAETAWLRHAARRRARAWQRDYPWPEDGVLHDDRPRMLLFDILGLAALLPMLALLHAPLWLEPARVPAVVWVFLGLFDLLVFGGLAGLLRRVSGRWRQGRVRVKLAHQPLRPGDRCPIEVWLPDRSTQATLELRGVSERVELARNPAPKRWIKSRCFFREPLAVRPLPGGGMAAEIAIPADAPVTQLAAPPVTYWEIVVRRDRDEAAVLLPVYGL